ncbi:MAG TPA: hypothetical protein VGK63_04495 [Candidatus Limnocylindrales bacterium]
MREWEFEANRRGVDQQTSAFWVEGEAFIRERHRQDMSDRNV